MRHHSDNPEIEYGMGFAGLAPEPGELKMTNNQDGWMSAALKLEVENKELKIALNAILVNVQAHMIDACPPGLRYAQWGKETFELADRILARAGLKVAKDQYDMIDHGRGIVSIDP